MTDQRIIDWPVEVDNDGIITCGHVQNPVKPRGRYIHCNVDLGGFSTVGELYEIVATHVTSKHPES